jgi:hypothetical protein
MPIRRLFLCFHFESDLWRVNQIRGEFGAGMAQQAGYFDPVEYEALLCRDKASIRRMIRERIEGTSVTLVLIGSQTASRPIVQLGIEESIANRNGFLGIHIHGVDDQAGEPSFSGPRPILPDDVEFPCFLWDWDLARLTEEIEAAGLRADRWRSASQVGSRGGGGSDR